MKAIYETRQVCVVIEEDGDQVLLEPIDGTADQQFWVDIGDSGLTLDPTDGEMEQATEDTAL